jgi:hypothetical protein
MNRKEDYLHFPSSPIPYIPSTVQFYEPYKLDGLNQLPKVILGVKFTDGIEVVRSQAQAAAA